MSLGETYRDNLVFGLGVEAICVRFSSETRGMIVSLKKSRCVVCKNKIMHGDQHSSFAHRHTNCTSWYTQLPNAWLMSKPNNTNEKILKSNALICPNKGLSE